MTTVMIDLQTLRPLRSAAVGRPPRQVYLRRRLVVLVALLMLLTCAGLLVRAVPSSPGGHPASAPGRAPAAGAAPAAAAAAPAVYVVQPGDTLWSIGQRLVGANGDVADVVDSLIALNGGTGLDAGQRLLLPD